MTRTAKGRARSPARPVMVSVGVIGLWIALWVAGSVRADTRDDQSVRDELARTGAVVVRVELDFDPESFQLMFFQQVGTMQSVNGRAVCVRITSPSALNEIEKTLWIAGVGRCL